MAVSQSQERTQVVVICLFAAMACGSPQSSPQRVASPAPSQLPSIAPLASWQAKGATEVPPASVRQVSMRGIEVVNQTQGAVSDADARRWASALLLSVSYELWAVSHMQDAFLQKSGLNSAPLSIYRPDLTDIAGARQAGMTVLYTQHAIRRLVLRSVSERLRETFAGAGFDWKPYAFFLDAVGPGFTYWIDASGNRTVKAEIKPGEAAYELIGGELAHDLVLGDVWVSGSDFDCLSPPARQQLAPLCNP